MEKVKNELGKFQISFQILYNSNALLLFTSIYPASSFRSNCIAAATAKASHRSFSGWPACPFIQLNSISNPFEIFKYLCHKSGFLCLRRPFTSHLESQPSLIALTTYE